MWALLMCAWALQTVWRPAALGVALALGVAPVLLAVSAARQCRSGWAPTPRWEERALGALDALEAVGLEWLADRWRARAAWALGRQPELGAFAMRAGWNPIALALAFGPLRQEEGQEAQAALCGVGAPEAERVGRWARRLEAWFEAMAPHASWWEAQAGWASGSGRRRFERANAKISVKEWAFKAWIRPRDDSLCWGVDPVWATDKALMDGMEAARERLILAEGLETGAQPRPWRTRPSGRL